MVRLLLLLLLAIFVVRALWRLVDGIIEGATGRPRPTRSPQPGVQMARDPVCGTFVVPNRAVILAEGRGQVYFCSTKCRDKYRARTA
jgi:YHS domain-containing protein